MKGIAAWSALLAVTEAHYPRAGGHDRQLMPLESMLHIPFLQQGDALSDPAVDPDRCVLSGFAQACSHKGVRCRYFAAQP
uniref:Uncharacterized protein n=1 Tax=Ralstonia solanacearum TaxID=305 RepID=A0A0S4TX86_RALSL|nr:protein of unknown function [Ralstonia solanacearum]